MMEGRKIMGTQRKRHPQRIETGRGSNGHVRSFRTVAKRRLLDSEDEERSGNHWGFGERI